MVTLERKRARGTLEELCFCGHPVRRHPNYEAHRLANPKYPCRDCACLDFRGVPNTPESSKEEQP